MTIPEFKTKRNELNLAIAQLIHQFEQSTGFSVTVIEVDRAHWRIGNIESDNLLGVKVKVELPEGI
jgi:hypothetical protein